MLGRQVVLGAAIAIVAFGAAFGIARAAGSDEPAEAAAAPGAPMLDEPEAEPKLAQLGDAPALPRLRREPRQPSPDESQPGPTDPGPTDPGPTDPGPSDPGPSDPGPSDPGPSDPGPSDPDPPGDGPIIDD